MKILVGYDGSDKDAAALRWALDVGTEFGASIEVIHALGVLESSHRMRDCGGESRYDHAVADTKAAIATAVESVGFDAEALQITVVPGDPVLLMLRLIDERTPELVVLGRRPWGGHGHTTALGSVSREVVARACVPVVVVPAELHANP